MSYLWQEPVDTAPLQEQQKQQEQLADTLRLTLDKGVLALLRLPGRSENQFRQHARERAASLLQRSVYGLLGIYLLVVLPISIFSKDAGMLTWQLLGMLPIALVLTGLWISTRLSALENHVEATLSLSLFVCLCGTLFCSLRLGHSHFGQMAAYETIYILIIAFSILRLPTHFALLSASAAFGLSLAVAFAMGLPLYGLDMLLYFGVPLLICAINGYLLEYSERRAFVQNLLLNLESQGLVALRADAEAESARQQRQAEFLALLNGNPGMEEVCKRTLRFLVSYTGADVAAAYEVDGKLLRRVASWAGSGDDTEVGRNELPINGSLLGPALQSRRVICQQNMRADYLPLRTGMGQIPAAELMMLPIYLGEEALAIIELGRLSAFSAEEKRSAEAVLQPLALALMGARARRYTPAPQALAQSA
ncbi:MAG: GAF domain-containing protein [Moraxellaceae bacterium]